MPEQLGHLLQRHSSRRSQRTCRVAGDSACSRDSGFPPRRIAALNIWLNKVLVAFAEPRSGNGDGLRLSDLVIEWE